MLCLDKNKFWSAALQPYSLNLLTDQLNPLFHIFADLVNKVAARQTTDWLVGMEN